MDLSGLALGFEGKRFCELVSYHLRRQNQKGRIKAIISTVSLLPDAAQNIVEGFIDKWNNRAYNREFWQRDCADVFEELIGEARIVLEPLGFAMDDEVVFNFFNVVVLSYAYNAYKQPEMREFMGINREKFPWLSAIALLYPIGVAIYTAVVYSMNCAMVIGYGLTHLGYILFVAGIVKGTFNIFGLGKRWQVFGVAVLSFVFGVVLSNTGN